MVNYRPCSPFHGRFLTCFRRKCRCTGTPRSKSLYSINPILIDPSSVIIAIIADLPSIPLWSMAVFHSSVAVGILPFLCGSWHHISVGILSVPLWRLASYKRRHPLPITIAVNAALTNRLLTLPISSIPRSHSYCTPLYASVRLCTPLYCRP